MNKSIYEDYKYTMQDTGFLYVGAKYTLKEIMENEEILFKFRKLTKESFLPDRDGEDTLETVLYYLEKEDFLVQVLKQCKARIRVSVIEEKKHLFGKVKKEYTTKFLTVEQLVALSISEKEAMGMVIQELKISKLALLTV